MCSPCRVMCRCACVVHVLSMQWVCYPAGHVLWSRAVAVLVGCRCRVVGCLEVACQCCDGCDPAVSWDAVHLPAVLDLWVLQQGVQCHDLVLVVLVQKVRQQTVQCHEQDDYNHN